MFIATYRKVLSIMKKEIKQGMSELMAMIRAIRIFGVIKFIFYVVSCGWFFLVNLIWSENPILSTAQVIMVFILNYYIKKYTPVKKLQREVLILVIYIFEIILWLFAFRDLSVDYCISNLNVTILLIADDLIAAFALAYYLKHYTEIQESQRKNLVMVIFILKTILWSW